jgi:hypothetical protein
MMVCSLVSCNWFKSNGGNSTSSSNSSGSDQSPVSLVEGFQYDGSVALLSTAMPVQRGIQISGPIAPNVGILYNFEDSNFPKSIDDRTKLADDASLTFPWMLDQCTSKYGQEYPLIKLQKDGVEGELTQEELVTNYGEVARCSYDHFLSKPYWIPQLILDVDICGRQLGTDWRLITENDLYQLSQEDLQNLNQTLSGVGGNFWSAFYVGMVVYIKANDGTLKQADLSDPTIGPVVTDLPIQVDQYQKHLEGARTLRCIKVTEI